VDLADYELPMLDEPAPALSRALKPLREAASTGARA
jgi:hypothetical protein